MSEVKFTSHVQEVEEALDKAMQKALEQIGMDCERYAKELCPSNTGRLRNSISHAKDDDTAYIGTNVEYGIYVEYGTGVYVEDGSGRKDPWVYQDDKGHFHKTSGSPAHHFLRNAVNEHLNEYKQTVLDALKG